MNCLTIQSIYWTWGRKFFLKLIGVCDIFCLKQHYDVNKEQSNFQFKLNWCLLPRLIWTHKIIFYFMRVSKKLSARDRREIYKHPSKEYTIDPALQTIGIDGHCELSCCVPLNVNSVHQWDSRGLYIITAHLCKRWVRISLGQFIIIEPTLHFMLLRSCLYKKSSNLLKLGKLLM